MSHAKSSPVHAATRPGAQGPHAGAARDGEWSLITHPKFGLARLWLDLDSEMQFISVHGLSWVAWDRACEDRALVNELAAITAAGYPAAAAELADWAGVYA